MVMKNINGKYDILISGSDAVWNFSKRGIPNPYFLIGCESSTLMSYRMIGNPFPEQRLVSFQIQEALPIENGRVLDGTVSPTFALCRAEGSPSQNNPTPEEKADSGAM